jgi:hypothetical protein
MKSTPPATGPITQALHEAVAMRRQLLDSGMAEQEVDRIVGRGLKAILGNTRPQPWRFYCEQCRDTGWVNVEPSEDERARLVRIYGDDQQHQGYVVKCEPCKWTQMEREKRRKQLGQEGSDENDDFAAAGVKQKRGFQKLTR